MSDHLDTGEKVVNVEGLLVERDVLGIIEAIQDYSDRLVVMYIDPNRADFSSAPWLIAERCNDGLLRRVMEVWELDKTVLDRIRAADTHTLDVLDAIGNHNAKVRLEKERHFKDEAAELNDLMVAVLKNPKTTYSFPTPMGEIVTLDDHLGVVKREPKG